MKIIYNGVKIIFINKTTVTELLWTVTNSLTFTIIIINVTVMKLTAGIWRNSLFSSVADSANPLHETVNYGATAGPYHTHTFTLKNLKILSAVIWYFHMFEYTGLKHQVLISYKWGRLPHMAIFENLISQKRWGNKRKIRKCVLTISFKFRTLCLTT